MSIGGRHIGSNQRINEPALLSIWSSEGMAWPYGLCCLQRANVTFLDDIANAPDGKPCKGDS